MGKAKGKKITSTDVALLAGVSQTSVSLILSGNSKGGFTEETRARVLAAAEELGYHPPARRRKRDSSRLILALVPTLTNQFYTELLQALEQYADTLGYRMLVCNTFRKEGLERYYLEQLAGGQISGVIYTFLPSFPEEIARLSRRMPLVLIGEKEEDLPICSIELSNHRAGAMLAEHLYDLGHRRVTFISTPMHRTTLARRQRLEGLRRRLDARAQRDGEPVRVEVLVAQDSQEWDTNPGGMPYEYAVGQRLTREFLAGEGRSTALVGANDMIATGILAALRERGYRVPEDYSVCGFDNIFTASVVEPPLTTIDHRLWARCRSAVDMIVTQNSYEDQREKDILTADKIEYSPQIVIRRSTGPAPQSISID